MPHRFQTPHAAVMSVTRLIAEYNERMKITFILKFDYFQQLHPSACLMYLPILSRTDHALLKYIPPQYGYYWILKIKKMCFFTLKITSNF